VVERYGRPTLVLSHDGGEAHGSGRSISAFHLLDALESCHDLFTRYGGHSHAVGFSLPSDRVPQLRAHLDQYARQRLTPADFEPLLDLDAELNLDQVTPDLFRALVRLEPFGQANPEPIFSARGVRLMAPPRIMKDKHVKLKLAPAIVVEGLTSATVRTNGDVRNGDAGPTPEAIVVTPRCHPDAAADRRPEIRASDPNRNQLRTENWELRTVVRADGPQPTTGDWRKNVIFDALGWHMAERLQAANLLAGDTLDIAFTIGLNDHPEYGGLELALRDFQIHRKNSQ